MKYLNVEKVDNGYIVDWCSEYNENDIQYKYIVVTKEELIGMIKNILSDD